MSELVIGIVFVLGGLSSLVRADLPLFPILLIIAGAALVLSMFKGKRR